MQSSNYFIKLILIVCFLFVIFYLSTWFLKMPSFLLYNDFFNFIRVQVSYPTIWWNFHSNFLWNLSKYWISLINNFLFSFYTIKKIFIFCFPNFYQNKRDNKYFLIINEFCPSFVLKINMINFKFINFKGFTIICLFSKSS